MGNGCKHWHQQKLCLLRKSCDMTESSRKQTNIYRGEAVSPPKNNITLSFIFLQQSGAWYLSPQQGKQVLVPATWHISIIECTVAANGISEDGNGKEDREKLREEQNGRRKKKAVDVRLDSCRSWILYSQYRSYYIHSILTYSLLKWF